MTKDHRVAELLARLGASPARSDFDGARALLESVLQGVEDELCPADEERMGPPLDDNRRSVPGWPDVTRFRTKGHNVFIRANGALRIEALPDNELVLDKPGANSKRVFAP